MAATSLLFSLVAVNEANALRTATASVNCARAKLQTAIDNAAAGTPTRITVTGTCQEIIEIPRGKTITIVGGGTAILRPPASNTASSVVINSGELRLERITVTNPAASANLVVSLSSSTLEVLGSTLSGPSAEGVLEISGASTARILNSVIEGGTVETAGVYSQSTLEIFGRPTVLAHFNPSIGTKSVINSTATTAASVFCTQGGNLVIRAEGAGKVEFTNNGGGGINGQLCDLLIRNKATSSAVSFKTKFDSISMSQSKFVIENATLEASQGNGISLDQAQGSVQGVNFLNPSTASGDIALGSGSVLDFKSWIAPSSLPNSFNQGYQSISCSRGGKAWIDDPDIVLPAGKTVADLATAYPGCINN